MHEDVKPNAIVEMLESRLGYNFAVRELPPSLRARLKSLERDLGSLRAKSSGHEFEITSLDRQKKAEEENILNKYYAELRKVEYQKSELTKWRSADTFFQIIGVVAALFIIIIAFIPVMIAYMYGLDYGVVLVISFILGGLLLISPFIVPIRIRQTIQHRKDKRAEEEVQGKRNEIENQQNHDTNILNARYDGLRRQQSAVLEAKKTEIESLKKKFETDLNQTASEIDSALNVIFQARMDFGLLRTIIRNRGVIIEKILCPFCGGKIELPETGHVTKCEYCDRDVYAVDLFRELDSSRERKV